MLLSRLLWTIAIGCGLITLLISLASGRTPLTEELFAAALVAGALGLLVDRLRGGTR